jgi:hypothetical protein
VGRMEITILGAWESSACACRPFTSRERPLGGTQYSKADCSARGFRSVVSVANGEEKATHSRQRAAFGVA